MFIYGLLSGIIIGILIGLYYKLVLKAISYIIVSSIWLTPVAVIAYFFYFHTDDAIAISILIFSILVIIGTTKLINKYTFLNTDEAGAIVLGFAVNSIFAVSAYNDFQLDSSYNRSFYFIFIIVAFQIYAYTRGRIRHLTEVKGHNKSSNLTGA